MNHFGPEHKVQLPWSWIITSSFMCSIASFQLTFPSRVLIIIQKRLRVRKLHNATLIIVTSQPLHNAHFSCITIFPNSIGLFNTYRGIFKISSLWFWSIPCIGVNFLAHLQCSIITSFSSLTPLGENHMGLQLLFLNNSVSRLLAFLSYTSLDSKIWKVPQHSHYSDAYQRSGSIHIDAPTTFILLCDQMPIG